jgi:hypothetical protein
VAYLAVERRFLTIDGYYRTRFVHAHEIKGRGVQMKSLC